MYSQTLDTPVELETATETVPMYIDLMTYPSMLSQATDPQRVKVPGRGPTVFNGTRQ
jgi:hypothetical protein